LFCWQFVLLFVLRSLAFFCQAEHWTDNFRKFTMSNVFFVVEKLCMCMCFLSCIFTPAQSNMYVGVFSFCIFTPAQSSPGIKIHWSSFPS
jgi:hypothetical protein